MEEQAYLDGFRHGILTTRYSSGSITEVRYLLGRRYGDTVERGPDGEAVPVQSTEIELVQQGRFLGGYRHGKREVRGVGGRMEEVLFVENMRLEAWGLSGSDEEFGGRSFPDSGLTGDYVLHFAGRTNAKGPFVDGKMHGEWVFSSMNGTVLRGKYADDVREGDWTETLSDGAVGQGSYREGRKNGKWITRYGDGSVAEGPYENGMRLGEWVDRYPDGDVWQG